MQRNFTQSANYGPSALQVGQAQNLASQEKPRTYNYTSPDNARPVGQQLGNKNNNPQSHLYLPTSQSSLQSKRAISPTQVSMPTNLPLHRQKFTHPSMIQSAMIDQKIPAQPQFFNPSHQRDNHNTYASQELNSRNKTYEYGPNRPENSTKISEENGNVNSRHFQPNRHVISGINSPKDQKYPNPSIKPTQEPFNFSHIQRVPSLISNQPPRKEPGQKLGQFKNYVTYQSVILPQNPGQKIVVKNQVEGNKSDMKKSLFQFQSCLNPPEQANALDRKSLNSPPLINLQCKNMKNSLYFDDIPDLGSPGVQHNPNQVPLDKDKRSAIHQSGSQASFQHVKLPVKRKVSTCEPPSFLKKTSQKVQGDKEAQFFNMKFDQEFFINNSSNLNISNKASNSSYLRQRKESLPQKPQNFFNLPNSYSLNKNSMGTNSTSVLNVKVMSPPQNTDSATKVDAMKNLVNKKNSNVNSRKLDEQSPDKIVRQRRTLEETPRTSMDPTDAVVFRKKPDLISEMSCLVDDETEIKPTAPVRKITIDDLQVVQKIGRGTYGDVFLAQDRKTKFVCVIKALSKKKIKELQLEEHVFREIKIQSYLNHRHLASLYGVFDDQNKIYLVMEYMPDGSMSSNGKKKIKETEAAYLLQQVCEGLLYLHREDIIHRDIKPENLLMNNEYVKIADFGTSVFGNTMRRTVVGCLAYISPEQLTNTPYDDKIDAWSIGILAYELLVGKPPFEDKIRTLTRQMYDGEPIENIKKRIEGNSDFPQLIFPGQLNLSAEAKDFMKKLLCPDPFIRPDVRWALKQKFILKGREFQEYLDSQL